VDRGVVDAAGPHWCGRLRGIVQRDFLDDGLQDFSGLFLVVTATQAGYQTPCPLLTGIMLFLVIVQVLVCT